MHVLRIIDNDDRLVMGYMYNSIHRAKVEMLRRFQKRRRVKPYIEILETHWDSQLMKNLHVASFWFNPSYQYNTS